MRGLEEAILSDVGEIAIFGSASEGFSKANINCTIDESIKRFNPLVEFAKQHSLPVRGYVSCITECPFDGLIHPEKVRDITLRLFDLGCYEVSLGDTLGRSSPQQISNLFEKILKDIPCSELAGHFHDTKDMALENIKVALDFLMNVSTRKSVVFLISDFLDHDYWKPLKLVNKKHDLIGIRISDPAEQKIPNLGLLKIIDPESNEECWVDTSSKKEREFSEKSII